MTAVADAVGESDVRRDDHGSLSSDSGVDALTADGAVIRIRPVRATDAAGLTELHERASDETLYRRFLATGHHPIAGEVARLIRPPDGDHAVLVAVEHGRTIGVCSYEVLPGRDAAEFAIFVDDACHDRGIGTLLLEHLTVWGRRHGIPDLLGEVLPSNSPMLRMATGLGQPIRSAFELGLTRVHLDTEISESDTIDVRDLAAARHSLTGLLAPRRIAVVTTSTTHPTGDMIVQAIRDGGYRGTVYAVSPDGDAVAGIPAVASVFGVPHPVDLVVIDVPEDDVAMVLTDAAGAGAHAAVVLSAGFTEAGSAGQSLQADLVRIARTGGMRLVGPNSIGVINNDPAIRLHASAATASRAGGIAVASQSGAVGVSVLDMADRADAGIASFISLGNKADVSGNDLLSYWYDDPTVQVIVLYLESLGNPRRFGRIARAVGRRKPILVVKGGHGSAEVSDHTVDALFAQAGVIRCAGLGDIFGAARMLADQPVPTGNRIAIIGNSGGINVLCADAAAAAGLMLPPLPDDVQDSIRIVAPHSTSTINPVDLGTDGVEATSSAIAAVVPYVDALLIAFDGTAPDAAAAVAAISAAIDKISLPVAVILVGSTAVPPTIGDRRAPVYRLPEEAVGALGRAVRYGLWRATPMGHRVHLSGVDAAQARKLAKDALEAGTGRTSSALAAELVRCYGIPVASTLEPVSLGGQTVQLDVTIVHDPLFGSVVTCGIAGIPSDLLGDRSLRLLPITDSDAAEMWRGLRSAPLLTGYRGTAPVDTAAVEDLLIRIGRLAEDLPEVAALRLAPVIVTSAGVVVTSVEMQLSAVGIEPDSAMRALREPS
jgi:acyl-CoA synthetase (NDP forming)/GNAT superfamily N-acetyltransferase